MNNYAFDPMLVAHYSDRATGAEAWLVVDTFLHGVAGGGIRMAPDVTETLMKHLAATMSIKLSIVQPPLGGAKCGIRYDSKASDSKDVLARVVRAFAPFLRHCWVTGSDLGTDWHDIVAACRSEAGIPHPQYSLMKAYGSQKEQIIEAGIERLSQGTSIILDPSIDLRMSNAVTGWTVCVSAEEALAAKGQQLKGKKVAIQGFGAVGGSAAKFLAEAGANVVAISDEFGSIVSRNGAALDIPGLLQLRKMPAQKILDREKIRKKYNYEFVDRDSVLYAAVDVLVPAAGSYISIDIDRVQAKLIVEGANDPFTEEEEELFFRKGVTVIPDAIANAGSAGLYGLLVSGHVSVDKEAIFHSLREQVQIITKKVFERTESPPRSVLKRVARSRIQLRIRAGHSCLPNGLTAQDLDQMRSDDIQVDYRMTSPYSKAEAVGSPIEFRDLPE